MYSEWVLIFLLVISVLLIYIVLLLRKLLMRLESLPAAPAQIHQPQPAAAPMDSGQTEMDEEITAVIIAAIAAYEEDK